MATLTAPLRKTGIGFLGDMPWGTHFCHFFETKQDLLDTVLPFFKAGLEAREFCLWVVAEPLTEGEARRALRRIVPDLDRLLADGSIEIHSAREWYLRAGAIDLRSLIEAWDGKLAQALQRGFAGMRANASEAWLREKDWRDFSEYEQELDNWITGKPMIVFCSYPLASGGAARILDVARTHSFALAKRRGKWEVVETPEFRAAKSENRDLKIRHRWQCAVSDLGQAAIRTTDLPALMDEAAVVVAETLAADLSAVAELLPDRDEFRVLAGVGWEPGYVGGTVSAIGTPGRFMLDADAAIVVGSLRTDPRFQRPQVLLERGVVSLMAVIIRGRARPWGLFSVHSRRLRTFSPDEVGFLQSVANVLALAVERHELEVAQRREREALRAIFDNSPVMITFYDAEGRLQRVNREWERTVGWTIEEAQRLDFLAEAFPDPERLKEVRGFIDRAEGRWAEFRPRTRDGRFIDTQWMRVPLSDGSRIGFGLDVTERKRAEAERVRLLESERSARAAAEMAFERLRAIQSITESALARLALEDLLSELLARLRKALGGDFASVQLIDEEHECLTIRAADGVAFDVVAPVRVPLGEAVAGRIAVDGRPRIVHDLSTTDPSRIEGLPAQLRALLRGSMLGTPLQVEGRVIGVVSVASARPRRFTEEDLRLLQVVADRVAPAIERCRLMETVHAAGEQLKALSRRLLSAQEEERRRLAVELHDELGQVLSAVKINLATLERQSGTAPPPAHLRDALASVDRAMERVRDLALDLRPSVLDDLGLPAALRWYADRFARTTRLETHLSVEAVPHLTSLLETACFRVAQEALTNVARHAKARNVWVDLHLVGEALELNVRDDGVGFDADRAHERAIGGASMGLLGMQERVSLSGGELELVTRPGHGTKVRARFPLGGTAQGEP